MAVHRQSQPCFVCGEIMMEIHLDQSHVPPLQQLIGDTFIKHVCINKKCGKKCGKKKARHWREEKIPYRRIKRYPQIPHSLYGIFGKIWKDKTRTLNPDID